LPYRSILQVPHVGRNTTAADGPNFNPNQLVICNLIVKLPEAEVRQRCEFDSVETRYQVGEARLSRWRILCRIGRNLMTESVEIVANPDYGSINTRANDLDSVFHT
jgi:hypothetical protein